MVMQSTSAAASLTPLTLMYVPAPRVEGPLDVVVRIAAAGVCRTDLHLLTGQMVSQLPLILGHENAGWVHEIGSQVTSVAVGDSVLCYPFVAKGLSVPERSGLDTEAPDRQTPGITVDGGYAEYLRTNERSMVVVPAHADLASLTTLTDAGLAAYRACKRAATLLRPGDTAVVIGIGGLGHLAVQILKALSPARVIAVDTKPEALDLAMECGAHEAVAPIDLKRVLDGGARAVLDLVGADTTSNLGISALEFGGTYLAIGIGGSVTLPLADLVEGEKHIEGVFVGTYTDLLEVTELTMSGQVSPRIVRYPLEAANDALNALANGRLLGRAVLEP
ncbi:alcohol dehydrogenase catalytic domain-containing protein [Ilumatobacter sp.]|uniref:alcohol dehydrogenase catalytic domain-containing protein n=1 Tax=Ilumatobacter sp. TaxID=1967498 RepID=UPI00309CEA78